MEAERVPLGYGGAWCSFYERKYINILMPFNILVGLFRRFYFFMMHRFIHHDPIEIEIDNRARDLFNKWKANELEIERARLLAAEELLLRIKAPELFNRD